MRRLDDRPDPAQCAQLCTLSQVAADLQSLVPRLVDPLERLVLLDDALHFRLNGRKILF